VKSLIAAAAAQGQVLRACTGASREGCLASAGYPMVEWMAS
jgi:hypothetical protein